MIPRRSRLALWCMALLLSISLYAKGRVPAGKGEGAAFFHAGPRHVKVRLAGDFPHPGVYVFPDGTSLETAIKMTVGAAAAAGGFEGEGRGLLHSGDLLTLRLRGGKPPVLSLGKMGVKERILLRIPLDPDLLSAGEWDLLPGVGPVLSERIVEDRQKNGGFGSLEGVLRVPGMGQGKLAALKEFF